MARQDLTIAADVPIAVRDHGGDGPPVLLVHGLGGTLQVWDEVAPALGARAVAVDLRGHGLSGDAPWDWDAVLDDLELVADRLGLGSPAVVGHSLGGMLAVRWARRHPQCPAVVNLDGLRSAETDPEYYAGMEPDALDAALGTLRQIFDAQQAAAAEPLSAEQTAMVPSRATVVTGGATYARPGADMLAAVRHDATFRDSIPLLRDVSCPALVVLSTQDPPGAEGSPLMAAFRRGVRRDLVGLPPSVEVVELDAGHGMVTQKPTEVAALVRNFLAANVAGQSPGETSPVS